MSNVIRLKNPTRIPMRLVVEPSGEEVIIGPGNSAEVVTTLFSCGHARPSEPSEMHDALEVEIAPNIDQTIVTLHFPVGSRIVALRS